MGKRISHSEDRWQQMELASSPIVRCVAPTQAGTQCKREALAGSIVCDKHGGHLPSVQKRAKERYVAMADRARDVVQSILDNPQSSDAAKLKAAEMVMKATGMEDAKKVVVDIETDPVEKLFRNLLGDPDALMPKQVDPPSQPPTLNAGEVVQGEVVDHVQEEYVPVPENVRPLNGWADVDHSAPTRTPRQERIDTRIPKRLRDDLPPGA